MTIVKGCCVGVYIGRFIHTEMVSNPNQDQAEAHPY